MSKPNGWDERDHRLMAEIHCLPSYGLLAHGDRLISRESVNQIIRNFAEQRFRDEHVLSQVKK
jgi:hypothetical protein